MRPLYFVADPHIHNHAAFGGELVGGLNARCRVAVETLRHTSALVGNNHLIVLGDVFDTAKPSPPVMRAVQKALPKGAIILAGNHDRASESTGDHSLGPLHPVACVIDQPTVVGLGVDEPVLWCVPYRTGLAAEWFPKDVVCLAGQDSGRDSRPRILCFHLGIIDGKTPPFLRDARDAIPLEVVRGLVAQHGLVGAFAGNFHTRQVFQTDPPIVQVGTLCPTGFDNPGLEDLGAVTIFDTKLGLSSATIPGPRFIQARASVGFEAAMSTIKHARKQGHTVYLRLIATTPDEHVGFKAALASLMEPKVVQAGEVLLDDVEAEVVAGRAAKRARSAETLTEAIAAYVKGMELPPGVTVGEVLERVQRFLKG